MALLLLAGIMVRSAHKSGGAFKIRWQPFAFEIKYWATHTGEPDAESVEESDSAERDKPRLGASTETIPTNSTSENGSGGGAK
jgi:hypothetical protein